MGHVFSVIFRVNKIYISTEHNNFRVTQTHTYYIKNIQQVKLIVLTFIQVPNIFFLNCVFLTGIENYSISDNNY